MKNVVAGKDGFNLAVLAQSGVKQEMRNSRER
jgi:hypothetical protein